MAAAATTPGAGDASVPGPSAPPAAAPSAGSGAASALALLLREDPLLLQHGLTSYRGADGDGPDGGGPSASPAGGDGDVPPGERETDDAAHSYAAALLHDDSLIANSAGLPGGTGSVQYRQRAAEALAEVDRKLALVESLGQRISRDAPEEVAGPLLRLHGFELLDEEGNVMNGGEDGGGVVTLATTRDKAERIQRQSQVLDSVARRVESTLQRGVSRMESATTRLGRVLELSATLKMILRLQFEARKVQDGSGLDLEAGGRGVDLRDLTRAAASAAAMEELLSHPSLRPGDDGETIDAVERLRPEAEDIARRVRKAAAGLMDELTTQDRQHTTASSLSRLGATLQVYFHLGELPDAVWESVTAALKSAEKASGQLFHPGALKKMKESAEKEARGLAEAELAKIEAEEKKKSGGSASTKDSRHRKKRQESIYQRLYLRKLRERRAEAAARWTEGVSDASGRVWNLHRVLSRRNDPVSRRNFLEVVAEHPVPSGFGDAESRLVDLQNRDADVWSEGLSRGNFSLFTLFWNQMSIGLGGRVQRLLNYDGGSLGPDVAALYPAVRSSSLGMVTEIYDTMQMGLAGGDDGVLAGGGYGGGAGVMGGSAGLEDSVFLGGGFGLGGGADEAAGAFGGSSTAADAWTHVADDSSAADQHGPRGNSTGAAAAAAASASSAAAVFSSSEWTALEGEEVSDGNCTGLLGLQSAFLKESTKRLHAPLEFMFPEAVSVDENGLAVPVLPTLPSRYDLAKLDAAMREELSLADPRQGGGDLGMAAMISAVVVGMLREFCGAARRAVSEVGDGDGKADTRTSSLGEGVTHNLNVAGVMSNLANFVRNAPDATFVNPYRPAQSAQHEEASHACRVALQPALQEIDSLVGESILDPLCRSVNRKVSAAVAKMHRGTYLQEATGQQQQASSSFVQIYLTDLYDEIATKYLSQLPGEYAVTVASTVATYSIYCFVSNAALLRPLGETGRLKLTQDLADFEMALEQLVFKGGTSLSLSQIAGGKPYAELRAVRQLLYWNGLEDRDPSPAEVAKGLLRAAWVKDLRPSTLFHFLFSFAPSLLTSPHHFKRMEAGEYADTLVKLDGSVDDGEASAWMTTMACCDAYQQRASTGAAAGGRGDRRVGTILMILGPELLRRRRQ